MLVTIEPGFIRGSLQIPASKSMMQRVCAGALLHQGTTVIHNAGNSDDDKAALHIITQLGAGVQYPDDNRIEITGSGLYPSNDIIDCGESGLSARLFLPIIALVNKCITVTGKGTLMKRPMHILDKTLPQLGVVTKSSNGYLPFYIQGPLTPRSISIDGSTSSQYLTGLLFAFSHPLTTPVTIQAHNLKSKPYIDMTLQVLELFGKPVQHHNYEYFIIDPSLFRPKSKIELSIESDWSSASFWLVAGVINGSLSLSGLDTASAQADKAILKILEHAGAAIEIDGDTIRVSKTENLKNFAYDATDTPDLFPILAVLAAYCKGASRIKGISRLLHKESNRLESVSDMLARFHIPFSIQDDELIVEGGGKLQGCSIDSYHDHRIAMAAAIAGLSAQGPVIIRAAEAVSKSYPGFFSDLSLLGGKFSINNNEQ